MAAKISDRLKKIVRDNSFSAEQIKERTPEVIGLSPVLNYLLGGGISSGSMTIITGKQKLGKTATCLFLAKKAQEAGYKVVLLDAEHRLTKRDLETTDGLDLSAEKMVIYSSTEESVLTAEDFMSAALYHVQTDQRCVIIADSVSMMCPRELLEADIGDRFRDPSPALLSRFCKVMLPHVAVSSNMFVAVTHLMANTSGMGRALTTEASGGKIQYAENFKLKATHTTPIEDKTTGKRIGLEIHFECINTALGEAGKKSTCRFMFNGGIDETSETAFLAKEIGGTESFRSSGAWYYVGDEKFQGEAKAIAYLREQPELVTKIRAEIKESLGLDYDI